jgi:hypothetical protein
MSTLEDETVLFLYCWTVNEMQIPAARDRQMVETGHRSNRQACSHRDGRTCSMRNGLQLF